MLRVEGLVPLFAGIRCLKAKSALKVCTICRKLKITIGIMGFALGRGDGIEEPYWGSLTACPDDMKQRRLETLDTDMYFPLKKA